MFLKFVDYFILQKYIYVFKQANDESALIGNENYIKNLGTLEKGRPMAKSTNPGVLREAEQYHQPGFSNYNSSSIVLSHNANDNGRGGD